MTATTGRKEVFAKISEVKAWIGVAVLIKRDRASKRFMNVPRLAPQLMPYLLEMKAVAVVYRERIAGALKAKDRLMRPRILHGLAKGPAKSGESAA